jgi:signal transduction histidine kinase
LPQDWLKLPLDRPQGARRDITPVDWHLRPRRLDDFTLLVASHCLVRRVRSFCPYVIAAAFLDAADDFPCVSVLPMRLEP